MRDMPSPTKEISGKWVVIGMFAFATSMISVLWIYSIRHASPFRPLQRALAKEFVDSAPKVEGGQRKINRNTPRILRIIMKVKFDPAVESDRAEQLADKVIAFSQEHHDFNQHEVVEIHFFHLMPEQEIKQWQIERQVADLLKQPQTD